MRHPIPLCKDNNVSSLELVSSIGSMDALLSTHLAVVPQGEFSSVLPQQASFLAVHNFQADPISKDTGSVQTTWQSVPSAVDSVTSRVRMSPKPLVHKTDRINDMVDKVIAALKTATKLQMKHIAGWVALRGIWNISPEDLDVPVLTLLTSFSQQKQNEILLSFATMDLNHVTNLSAYLTTFIQEHGKSGNLCFYFLAGLCDRAINCGGVHPENTLGWNTLRDRWGVTYRDFDFAALHYLAKQTTSDREDILLLFASRNLGVVKNPSACLSTIMGKFSTPNKQKQPNVLAHKSPHTQTRLMDSLILQKYGAR